MVQWAMFLSRFPVRQADPAVRWFLYNLFFGLVSLAVLPRMLLRMRRRGGYDAHFEQRFGRYSVPLRARLGVGGAVWIHAVSVGEVYVAGQLMRAMRTLDPATRFVLSTTSSTGWREAEKLLGDADTLIYNPLDFPWMVRRALDAIRPRAFLLVETELWPNWIRACAARGIPLALVNGRMSDKTAATYRLLRFWFGPVLRQFDRLLVQSALDADRFVAAGASRGRIEITGSFKFDVAQRQPEREQQTADGLRRLDLAGDRLLLLGGSTWPDEERILLELYRSLQPRHPGLRLALVPRHFERREDVAAQIRLAGLGPVLKSRLDSGSEPPAPLTADDVLLVDTTGELMGFYAHAAIVFVGRSLATATGGQNMIEPCLCGVPTIVGPHTENFRPVMADLLASDAILQVADARALRATVEHLIDHPDERRALGERASRAVTARRGVVAHSAARLLDLLPPCPATQSN
jgi:3-deoxy-D-manno-octulosonic-acid transferase